jgi:hypothetical protein
MLIKFIVSKYESFFYVHLGSIRSIFASFYLVLVKIHFLTPMATQNAILKNRRSYIHTHTHTHIYIHIYIYKVVFVQGIQNTLAKFTQFYINVIWICECDTATEWSLNTEPTNQQITNNTPYSWSSQFIALLFWLDIAS